MDLSHLIILMGIPSAITGFCFWILQHQMEKHAEADRQLREARQKEVDEREDKRQELQYLLIKDINASITLSEATARAVQRIPDAHCNGDMEKALDYALKVKREQEDFLNRHGIENIIKED